MKRLLSIILALSMLAVFVPAVSAEAADAQPNFTIKYDITGDLAAACGGAAMSAPLNTINLDYTNGFYAMGTAGWHTNWVTAQDQFKPYGTGENLNIAMSNGLHAGVKVWVPMAGEYTLKVNYATGHAFKQDMRVYWHKDTYDTSDASKIGNYRCPAGEYSTVWNEQFLTIYPTPFEKKVVASAPGYYYVGFLVGGTGGKITDNLRERASFASISLVSGTGEGNAIVLGSITEPFALDTVNNKTQTVSATGYLSQTREAVKFKYKSDNLAVATVNETTGEVTAVSAGTANITATSANDGDNVTVPLTTTVTVTDPTAYAVTYDIGGTIKKYKMKYESSYSGTILLDMEKIGYLHTNGFFKYSTANPSAKAANSRMSPLTTTYTFDMQSNSTSDAYIEFEINVPESGNYKLWMDHDLATGGGYVDVKIDGTRVGSYDCYSATADKAWFGSTGSKNHTQSFAKVVNEDGSLGNEATFHLEAGKRIIRFVNRKNTVTGTNRGSVGTFKLIKGGDINKVKVMHGYATVAYATNGVPVTTLTNGHVVDATAAVYNTDGTVAQAATTLESTDPSVLAVNGTKVTAVGQGKAKIKATVTYNDVPYEMESNEILVTDPSIASNTVSFYANATDADAVLTIEGVDGYTQGSIGSIAANKEITLTAPEEVNGKAFRGWMRGSKDNGVWISPDEKITITILTHTFLTAVYDTEDSETATTVEFWNWNGQYLGSKPVDKGTAFGEIDKPEPTSLAGYTFSHWSDEDKSVAIDNAKEIVALTRAVAQHSKTAGNFYVTVGDGIDGASGNYEFDTEVELASASGDAVYWYRDGKLVDYGTTYSFHVWDATTVSVSDNGNKGPRVILDKHETLGHWMIEYDNGDEGNKRIIEAGILFGENANITSFSSKAVSSKNSFTHGQFTAVPNNEADMNAAVGYIIYLDGGVPRVLYTK